MLEITLEEICRYPVKSMLGESLAETLLGEQGIPGDRSWATRDEKRGGIRGAKKIPRLMLFSARTSHSGVAEIQAPDGSLCLSTDTDINAWLSEKLEHSVSLWPLLPADNLDHYRRGAPDSADFEEELRTLFGRLPEEPLPDLSAFSEVLEFESPPGTYFDAFPLMLATRQSLNTLSARAPTSRFDPRRFRANFIFNVVGSDAAYPEQDWIGRELHVGDAVLKIVDTCPRCSMTTHATADLPRDTEVMRHLVKEADGNLGVYAKVVKQGEVRAGQTVTIV